MPTIRSAATALLAALAISLMTAGIGIADDTPWTRGGHVAPTLAALVQR